MVKILKQLLGFILVFHIIIINYAIALLCYNITSQGNEFNPITDFFKLYEPVLLHLILLLMVSLLGIISFFSKILNWCFK